MQIYKVGGAVRDALLGIPVIERDWVVIGATEAELTSHGFLKVGKGFPVFLHPETQEEYALARKERKTARGYYGFECDFGPEVSLEEDLQRRDLTINAMAETMSGEIIDPYGGQADLENRVLRHVSPAFMEDPVRILRIARFAARFAPWGFKIADETQHLMCQMVASGELDALIPERIWKECVRALETTHPGVFIEVLRSCGALKILWPELDLLWGIPQTEKYHPEIDTGIHILLALEQACLLSPDPVVRFAVLCHDLGKGLTQAAVWPKHHGHENAGVPLVEALCRRYRVPTLYQRCAVAVTRFHLQLHQIRILKSSTILKLLMHLSAFRGDEILTRFVLACEADARGRLGFSMNAYPQAELLLQCYHAAKVCSVTELADTGLKGIALGAALTRLRVRTIEHVLTQSKAED